MNRSEACGNLDFSRHACCEINLTSLYQVASLRFNYIQVSWILVREGGRKGLYPFPLVIFGKSIFILVFSNIGTRLLRKNMAKLLLNSRVKIFSMGLVSECERGEELPIPYNSVISLPEGPFIR